MEAYIYNYVWVTANKKGIEKKNEREKENEEIEL